MVIEVDTKNKEDGEHQQRGFVLTFLSSSVSYVSQQTPTEGARNMQSDNVNSLKISYKYAGYEPKAG